MTSWSTHNKKISSFPKIKRELFNSVVRGTTGYRSSFKKSTFCGAKYRWTPFRLIFSALQRAPVQKYCQVQVDAVLPVKYTLT
ncbi:MAG: hypothetical protein ABFC98_03260, partial [Candidatus Cloacimonas sp.]